MNVILSLVVFICVAESTGIYVYQGNPYTGKLLPSSYLNIGGKEYKDVIPYFTEVYYPTVSGDYAAVFFVPGFYGLIPPELYIDTLTQLAGRGYIVMCPSIDLPTLGDGKGFEESLEVEGIKDKLRETLLWLKYNLNEKVFPENKIEAKVNWSYVGLGGHSGGGGAALDMIMNDTSIAKAVAYMEPFSFDLRTTFNSGLPSLAYATQFCEEAQRCCIKGYGYEHFYKYLGCPKIQMKIMGFGHCDMLTNAGWEICHLTHMCKTDEHNDRVLYRHTVSGVMAAFFGTYVQGNRDQLQYVTNSSLIPIPVTDLLVDVNC